MSQYPIMESLYYSYIEGLKGDPEQIKELYGKLDQELQGLTKRESNEALSVVCHLCSEHERRAYIAGFRDAVSMMHELSQFGDEIATSLRSSR